MYKKMNKLISINCQWTKSRNGPQQQVPSSSSKNPSASSPPTNPDNKSPKNRNPPKSPSSTSLKKSETCAKKSSTSLKPSNPKTRIYSSKNTVVRPIPKRPAPSSTWSAKLPSIATRIKYLGNYWRWKRTKIRTKKIRLMKTPITAKKTTQKSTHLPGTSTKKSKGSTRNPSKIIHDWLAHPAQTQNLIIFTLQQPDSIVW